MKTRLYFSILLNIVFFIGMLVCLQKLGGLRYVWFKLTNNGVAGVYEHRKDMFTVLPKKKNSIVFLGDSITEQCEWAELLENSSIENRGIAGDMTDGVLRRLPLILENAPAKIFLMIGVNDLLFRSPSQILTNYEQILQQILEQKPPSKVYIQSLLPVNNSIRRTSVENEDILKVNIGLRAFAQKYKLDYIDLHARLKDAEGQLNERYSVDGIHLNGVAYLVWKETLNPYL